MQDLLDFFETIPSSYRSAILASGIAFFWIFEEFAPLATLRYSKWRHAALNLTLTVFQLAIGIGFGLLILRSAEWTASAQFGVLHWIEMPVWLQLLVALPLLDLIGAYAIHVLEHKVPILWRFHIVHHTDREVDVTTGLRHHPVETVFRSVFTILAVLLTGAPLGMVFLYQTLSVFFAHLTHANVNVPAGLDRALSLVFVTPNFHKAHHHEDLPLTDTNYGNIFSIWDRVFRTASDVDARSIRYGIDTHPDEETCRSLRRLLTLPLRTFQKTSARSDTPDAD